MTDAVGRVAILFRGDRADRDKPLPENSRLWPVFEALEDLGIAAERAVYGDEFAELVREQLLRVDGVLVWADPIRGGEDRKVLDGLLREVSEAGVFVSTHPETILKMGTKEVLFRTREMSWGTDTDLYSSFEDFQARFPARLASGVPRVIKQNRGNGGIGVWKVELAGDGGEPARAASVVGGSTVVRVQHAAPRDTTTEDLALESFMARCAPYFEDSGSMIDQPFVERIAEGMIRAYLVGDEVVGFARQNAEGAPAGRIAAPPGRVLGLPAAKIMFGPSEPEFHSLRTSLESEWVPQLLGLVGLEASALPLLWDADFLYGPRTDHGGETYILCEINVSSVSPFPGAVPRKLAKAVWSRLVPREIPLG
jgi:glutathione synthase/RimK-type ligase-like ATP-grasp enzyme